MLKKSLNKFFFISTGLNYFHFLKEISTNYHQNSIESMSNDYLSKILNHSYQNCNFYKNRMIEAGLNLPNINDSVNSRFRFIEPITKNQVAEGLTISKDYNARKWYENASGGSTGTPTKFIQDLNYKKWYIATSNFYYTELLDLDEISSKKVILWGSSRDLFDGNSGITPRIINWINNQCILNSFRINEDDFTKYVQTINRFKPEIIRGYAASLYEMARFIEKKHLKISSPKVIISSAENLTDEMRATIQEVFGCPVYNFYGSRETASIAGECRHGKMHVFNFNNFVEIVDDGNNYVKEGQTGKILVTNLHNYAMPFIRYEIGDMATVSKSKCKCGSSLPLIGGLQGRIQEQFIKKDGSIVFGYFFVHLLGVLHNGGFVKKFQLIQKEYDKIVLKVVAKKKIDPVQMSLIEEKIKVAMGKDCKIKWEYVDDIPSLSNGKYLYTKSLVH